MVTVIGKDDRLKKRATCGKCASILEYWPNEVRSASYTDYGGGRDTYYTILCPCQNVVEVPSPR